MMVEQAVARKKVACIVPVFNEAENIAAVYDRLRAVFQEMDGYEWELLLVDDGSTDNSWEVIKELASRESNVDGLCLSRNFGKEFALTAGIEAVRECGAVVLLDADLQHPPEKIPEMAAKWEQGAEVVVGIRKASRGKPLFKRFASCCFYGLMKRFSELDIPPNSTDFRLLDWKVAAKLREFSERTRIFRGLVDWMGYRRDYVEFTAPIRGKGEPGYSFGKRLELAINSFTSFSLLPLRVTGYFGLVIMFLTGPLLLYMVLDDFFFGNYYTARAYFIVFNTLLVGILLAVLGLIGLYIGQIYREALGRPLYIVRERIRDIGEGDG